jgi:phosphate transport system permease protein
MSMPATKSQATRTYRRGSGSTSLLAHGESMVWLMGGALAVCAVMVVGLLTLVVWQGGTTFWPRPVERIELAGGTVLAGEVTRRETIKVDSTEVHRRLVRTGNFELTGVHFEWVNDADIARETHPEWAVVLERRAWGRFYGEPLEFRVDGRAIASGPEAAWSRFEQTHRSILQRFNRRYKLQRDEFGEINARTERSRLNVLRMEREHGAGSPEHHAASAIFEGEEREMDVERRALEEEISSLDRENARYELRLLTARGDTATVAAAASCAATPPTGSRRPTSWVSTRHAGKSS